MNCPSAKSHIDRGTVKSEEPLHELGRDITVNDDVQDHGNTDESGIQVQYEAMQLLGHHGDACQNHHGEDAKDQRTPFTPKDRRWNNMMVLMVAIITIILIIMSAENGTYLTTKVCRTINSPVAAEDRDHPMIAK